MIETTVSIKSTEAPPTFIDNDQSFEQYGQKNQAITVCPKESDSKTCFELIDVYTVSGWLSQ